jgi:RNA polymerase sigma factor (sigma-70 family)
MNTYDDKSVEDLARDCRKESLRFQHHRDGTTGSCFELFRRAVVDRCQGAWSAIYAQYGDLVLSWIGHRSPDAEDLVQRAFEKFLRAVSPQVFARFVGIGGVLAYLRRCARSVYIDHCRKLDREYLALAALGEMNAPRTDPAENVALDQVALEQCLEYIGSHLQDAQERLVVYLSFEMGLKPAEIARRYPAQFSSPRQVNRIKERVIRRLSEDPVLKTRFESLF